MLLYPKKKDPRDGHARTVKRFLWLPTRLPVYWDKDYVEERWLEYAWIYQIFTYEGWENLYFDHKPFTGSASEESS